MAFRKRTYASAFNGKSKRTFKKRKFSRRTKRKGGKRTIDYTTFNTTGHSVGFRGRKISRRAYKNHIWTSTIFKPHYRSYITQDINLTTPGGVTDGTIQFLNMYKFGGNGFGTVAGGAVPIDDGGTVPTWSPSSFVLRGGKYSVTVSNENAFDLKLKLWRITTGDDPDFTAGGNIGADDDFAWDPSATPDFNKFIGKPFGGREVTIGHGDQYTYTTRFKTQKIDTINYDDNARSPYLLIFVTAQNGNVSAAFKVLQSYNLSYTADAIA